MRGWQFLKGWIALALVIAKKIAVSFGTCTNRLVMQRIVG